MANVATATARTLFVTGLQNAHAVENQGLAMIDRQLDRTGPSRHRVDVARIDDQNTGDEFL